MKNSEPHERLLVALAEQLKLPLIQIARSAELVSMDNAAQQYQHIAHTAEVALRLIDGYILSLLPTQSRLQLEPVSVAAVLQDTAHRLSELARQYDCEVQVSLKGRYGPVMANRESLEAAFAMLGYSFIESQPQNDGGPSRLILGAHRSSNGLVAGIFGPTHINADMFRRGRALFGTARQPLGGISATSSAGVFIADSLLQSMAAPLHAARHQKMNGLAATLVPSMQLTFGDV